MTRFTLSGQLGGTGNGRAVHVKDLRTAPVDVLTPMLAESRFTVEHMRVVWGRDLTFDAQSPVN